MADASAADLALSSSDAPPDDVKPIDAPAEAAPPADTGSGADAVSPEEPPQFDPRLEVPPSLGPVRRSILDSLLDSKKPLSVAELLAQMPAGTSRNLAESSIHRELVAGRIERVSPGTYRIAPPKPPAPPEPPPHAAMKTLEVLAGFAWQTDPAALRVMPEAEWNRVLDAYFADPATWPADIGPPPDADGSRAPFDLVRRARDRHRKKMVRAREAEERAARQREADAALVAELVEAAGGYVRRGPALHDVGPIRAALADGIPIDVVTTAIRWKCDRRIDTRNEPAASWREERILRAIADLYCRQLIRNMVAAWSATGNTPQDAADAPDASATVRDHPAQKTHPRSSPHAHHVAGFVPPE